MAEVYGAASLFAAQIAGQSTAMDAAANRVHRHMVALAMESRLTGAFIDGFVVATVRGEQGNGRRVMDRVVSSTDPGTLAIEYGHTTTRGTHVPGKEVMRRTLREVR